MANFGTIGIIAQARNFAQTVAAMSQFRRNIQFLTAANKNLIASNTSVAASAKSFLAALAAPIRAVQTLGQGIRNFGLSLKGIGNEIAAVGFRIGFLVSLPVFSFFGGATRAAADFEKALVQIINLTDVSAADIGSFRDQILGLAVTLGQTPAALTEGLLAVTSAGITDVSRAMEVLVSASKASAIGLGTIEDVARTVTGVMLAYGGQAGSAADITDILVAIVDQGNVELDQFGTELSRVTGLMSLTNVSLADGGAFLATFTQAGASGSEAITSLRATLAAILKPTASAEAALAEYKLTIEGVRSSIEQRGLTQTLIDLRNNFGLTGEAIGRIFPNIRALAGVTFVTGNAMGEFLDNLEKIQNSAGLVESGFARVQQTTAFQSEQLKASLQVLSITLGAIFLPAINAVIQKLLPFVGLVAEWARTHPQVVLWASAIALVVAVLAPLLVLIGLLISSLGTIIAIVGGAVTVFAQFAVPVGALLLGMRLLSRDVPKTGLAFSEMGDKAQVAMDGVANRAFGWGRNIVTQLARGIAEATIAVVQALIHLGNVIAHWLAPGSPPLLLPNLNEWGAGWMNEILKGFSQADFSIFNDVSQIIGRFFRSLGELGVFGASGQGVIPAIIGSREAVAEAIQQFRETGTISEEVLQRITGSYGQTSEAIRDYILSLVALEAANEDVAAAQENLAAVQESFQEQLEPINDELGAIARRRQEISDSLRAQELQAIISDVNAPALAKELAQLELREIALRQQAQVIGDNQDAAVDEAQAQLDAAEAAQEAAAAQAANQQAQIEAQIENNELIAEQISLLERLNDTLSGVGGGLGGDLGDLQASLGSLGETIKNIKGPDPLEVKQRTNSLTDIIGGALDELSGNFDQFSADVSATFDEITSFFSPLLGEDGLLAQLKMAWGGALDAIIERTPEATTHVSDLIAAIDEHPNTMLGLATSIGGIVLGLAGPPLLSSLFTALATAVSAAFAAIVPFVSVGGLLVALLIATPVLVGAAIDKYGSLAGALQAAWLGAVSLVGITGLLILKLGTDVGQAIQDAGTALSIVLVDAVLAAAKAVGDLKDKMQDFIRKGLRSLVDKDIPQFVKDFINWFLELEKFLVGESIVPDLVNAIVDWFTVKLPQMVFDAATGLPKFVADVTATFLQAGVDFVQAMIDGAVSMLQNLITALSQLISDAWTAAWANLPDIPGLPGGAAGGTTGNGTGHGGDKPGSSGGPGGPPENFASPAGPPTTVLPPPRIAAPPVAGAGVQVNFNNVINSPMDLAAFTAGVRQVLRAELGTA